MYNWHHSDRWRLHLRQFLGRRDRHHQWTPFTPGELNGDHLELRGDDNRLQFRITIHPDNWLFIEGQTEAARNLVNTLGHIASNGPSGNRRLHELHRLISYSDGGGTGAAAPPKRKSKNKGSKVRETRAGTSSRRPANNNFPRTTVCSSHRRCY